MITNQDTTAPICGACMRSDAYQEVISERDAAQTLLDVTMQDAGSVQAQMTTLQSQLTTANASLTAAQSALAAKTVAFNQAVTDMSQLATGLATAQASVASLTSQLSTAIAARDTANANAATLTSNLATATSQLATAQASVASLTTQVASLTAALAAKTAQYDALLVDEPAAYAMIQARLPPNFNGYGKDPLNSAVWQASTKPNILTTIVGSGASMYLALVNLRSKL